MLLFEILFKLKKKEKKRRYYNTRATQSFLDKNQELCGQIKECVEGVAYYMNNKLRQNARGLKRLDSTKNLCSLMVKCFSLFHMLLVFSVTKGLKLCNTFSFHTHFLDPYGWKFLSFVILESHAPFGKLKLVGYLGSYVGKSSAILLER